ncbi:MAG: kinase/pyrophosphorylase [Gammaproteobacteria bacterium]|nr:kinase/pyrophosphorylase [Gammaproteobacteria bacterium]
MTTDPQVDSGRIVYFVSDSTAITIEKLGQSLLSQFPETEFHTVVHRYVNSITEAHEIRKSIKRAVLDHKQVIVFSSILDAEVRAEIKKSNAIVLDIFESFLGQLEALLEQTANTQTGLVHGLGDELSYQQRIEAVNFSLRCDDGLSESDYSRADIILLGVSRCGKTPTCLYLALQYGIYAANYPLTQEDQYLSALPAILQPYHDKLLGLTIQPERLQQIRAQRRPDGQYASLEFCKQEVHRAEILYKSAGLPVLDSSQMSIEELATHILSFLQQKQK